MILKLLVTLVCLIFYGMAFAPVPVPVLNFGTMPDAEMITMMVNGTLPIQFDLTNIAIQNTTIPNLTMTTAIAMPEEPQPIRSTAINIRISDDPPLNKVSVSVTHFPIVLSPLLSFEPVYRRRSVYDLNFGTMPDAEMITMMVNEPIQSDPMNITIDRSMYNLHFGIIPDTEMMTMMLEEPLSYQSAATNI